MKSNKTDMKEKWESETKCIYKVNYNNNSCEWCVLGNEEQVMVLKSSIVQAHSVNRQSVIMSNNAYKRFLFFL